ncbi:hypothetical protein CMQ_5375 [Grosmannia clavigera kw1407]|uniref:Transmembrane protein n=1 Tax=Grosmannia clavigera (strain kw1407 / UAMH 11150) TaxID=655863 RepID=F0XBQ4_GROCL|nr:uncharacterized protein CMQ_5375 [Grosmannia clavigera kw1407]EFX05113.1 hypothetical protein CMQ_5375 [Grosmannia clavigera kw1407]
MKTDNHESRSPKTWGAVGCALFLLPILFLASPCSLVTAIWPDSSILRRNEANACFKARRKWWSDCQRAGQEEASRNIERPGHGSSRPQAPAVKYEADFLRGLNGMVGLQTSVLSRTGGEVTTPINPPKPATARHFPPWLRFSEPETHVFGCQASMASVTTEAMAARKPVPDILPPGVWASPGLDQPVDKERASRDM